MILGCIKSTINKLIRGLILLVKIYYTIYVTYFIYFSLLFLCNIIYVIFIRYFV